MIVGFVGKMGSGKTLSLTRQVYKEYKRGKLIISNVHFSFPYKPITIEMLLNYDLDDSELQNCVVVLDEAHVYLDSRASVSKKNRIISMFLTQTRKKNVHLYYTTQFFDQVDKRLRKNSEVIIQCKSTKYKKMTIVFNYWFIRDEYGFIQKRNAFVGNKFFNLYDTTQVIKFS